MRFVQTLVLVGALATAATGMAQAQGLFGGGTPDAQNGARGRDQPTSFQGRRPMYSGRSSGYNYGYAPRYRDGYGPAYRYAPRGYYAPY